MQAAAPEKSFLKGNDVYCSYADAVVAIAQAPYDGTASYGKGTATAPEAIVTASEFLEMYDVELQRETSSLGIATLPPLPVNGSPEQVIARVHDHLLDLFRDAKKPVLLGGEHSVTLGAVQAAREIHHDLGVVQFDAHADLRDSFEGSRFSHACVMRRILELGVPHAGVGIRSMSKAEAGFARNSGLRLLPATGNQMTAADLESLPDKLYVTLDIDVLDPACMPATGTPEPGGLNWNELVANIEIIAASGREIVAFDLVELAPIPGLHFCDYTAAKLVYKTIGMFWGK